MITATINGREYSRGNLADIYWSFGEMLAYASRGVEVQTGDVIAGGTCSSGCILELARRPDGDQYPWLKEGDELVLEVEQFGRLANTITFGPPPKPLRPELTQAAAR